MLRIGSVLLGILISLTPSASAGVAYWALFEEPCKNIALGAEVITLEAGEYGLFYVSSSDLPTCSRVGLRPLASGREPLRYYPSPGPTPVEDVDCPPGITCGTPLANVVAPWIAVVDWDNWHGKSVESMVLRSTRPGVQTALLELECVLAPCLGVSDVDLLAVLANLVQAVDRRRVPAPTALNMSLGRLRQADDAEDEHCDPASLSCQIRGLLEHLIQPAPGTPPRTLVLAAAGNHLQWLFPASLDLVHSVGSLDLRKFALSDAVQASWETPVIPEVPDALMPGTALCLELSAGGAPFQTPAPAGSSYATALFTGWLTEIFLDRPQDVTSHLEKKGLWAPYRTCGSTACPFLLTHGGTTFPSSSGNASDRIYEAFQSDPTRCGAVRGGKAFAELIRPTDNPFRRKSLIRKLADFLRPAPESNPCVPCVMCCQVVSMGPISWEPGASTRAAFRTVEIDLDIDLHSAWALPQGAELIGLYLKLGGDFKELEMAEPDQLRQIGAGHVAYLHISGTLQVSREDEQPSLISLLRIKLPDVDEPQEVWDATQLIWRPGTAYMMP